ncbi:malonyl-[acyl-carrier protein] O-methyltransferase BioC [Methylophaga sp. 42_25_T18]|nr:malonyl-[acyl-carrier protein] O-methyltransferase BioC [Methylophaga sp. 42_25_T18]OUR89211.1 malonyl-[acyl-carrier protein] O-methyltransferase BioC [Methylophaga sp. 42_8_T64]
MTNQYTPDKHQVAQSFAHAAQQYDDVAILQRQTADELLDRLSLVKIQPNRILDLGAGTGRNLSLLAAKYPKAELIALDIAPAMLKQAQHRFQSDAGLKRWLPTHQQPAYMAGDAEALPLADNSVDMVYANLSLQWCDPTKCFAEIQRVLRPGGLLSFTSLGPDTLNELRQAWAAVDDYPHVNIFYDPHDIGEAMMNSRLAEPVLDVDRLTLTYETAIALMKDLKELGAHNVNEGRRRGLTGKQAFEKVINAYEPFRKDGLLPASYEVIYGHAWCAEETQKQEKDGTVKIPVSQIARRTAS